MAFIQQDLINRAADYFAQARKPRSEWRKLDDLSASIAEFELRCEANEFDTACSVLTEIDFDYLLLWGHYWLLIDLHQKLMGRIKDDALKVDNLNGLGLAYWSIGQAPTAINLYEQALSITHTKKSLIRESAILGNLGSAYADLGDTTKAISYYEKSLAIAQMIRDRRGEGNILGNLGNAYIALNEINKAIEYHNQSLEIALDIGDRRGESNRLNSLGNAWAILGKISKAIKYYQKALNISQEIGNRRGEGNSLCNLGNAFVALSEAHKSIEFYDKSLLIVREIGDRRGEGATLTGLGNAFKALSENQKAVINYEQALDVVREIRDRRGEFDVLNSLGILFANIGNKEKTAEYYRQILKIVDETGGQSKIPKNELKSLRAFICYSSRDKAKARELHLKLNNRGFDVWIDEKKLIPGQEWELEIEKAIKSSDVIIICLSDLSVNSEGYIQKEIKVALDRADRMPENEIFIIPCRLNEVEMPQRLQKYQWADLFATDGLEKLELALSEKARKLGIPVKQPL